MLVVFGARGAGGGAAGGGFDDEITRGGFVKSPVVKSLPKCKVWGYDLTKFC